MNYEIFKGKSVEEALKVLPDRLRLHYGVYLMEKESASKNNTSK